MSIADDFGVRELTARQADDLYELISERAGRSLVLTSNRSPIDWYPLFPNAVVAESLLERLINTSHQAFINAGRDETLLATCSGDWTIRVWNLRTGELVHKLPGTIAAFARSPGLRMVLAWPACPMITRFVRGTLTRAGNWT